MKWRLENQNDNDNQKNKMATRKQNGDQKTNGDLKTKMTIRKTKWRLENKMATSKQNYEKKKLLLKTKMGTRNMATKNQNNNL